MKKSGKKIALTHGQSVIFFESENKVKYTKISHPGTHLSILEGANPDYKSVSLHHRWHDAVPVPTVVLLDSKMKDIEDVL